MWCEPARVTAIVELGQSGVTGGGGPVCCGALPGDGAVGLGEPVDLRPAYSLASRQRWTAAPPLETVYQMPSPAERGRPHTGEG